MEMGVADFFPIQLMRLQKLWLTSRHIYTNTQNSKQYFVEVSMLNIYIVRK